MTLKVVDLSNHNTPDLSKYPADAYVFKATEGKYFKDKNMSTFISQARARNKPFGLYHFMSNDSDAITQAKFFLSVVKPYIGEAVLVLDYEMYGRLGVYAAKQFLDYVYKETKSKPLVYMSASVTKEENWSNVVAAGYGLWVADYTPPLDPVGYWKSVTMWQYTETPYDKNTFYGNVDTWRKLAKGSNTSNTSKPSTGSSNTTTNKEGKFMSTLKLTDARNLRESASTRGKLIATLKKGDVVNLSGVTTREGYIWGIQSRANGKKGYITIKVSDEVK